MVVNLSVPDILMLVGSCFAITHYVIYERGLFDVLHRLRYMAGVNVLFDTVNNTFIENAGYVSSQDLTKNNLIFVSNGKTFGEIFSCHRCMTVWVTFIVALFYYNWLWPYIGGLIPLWLGLCGMTVFLLEVAHNR